MLVEEFAGRVVVLDRKPRAGDAVVFGGLLDQRQFRLDAGVTEIADADLDRLGRDAWVATTAQADRTTNHRIMVPP